MNLIWKAEKFFIFSLTVLLAWLTWALKGEINFFIENILKGFYLFFSLLK